MTVPRFLLVAVSGTLPGDDEPAASIPHPRGVGVAWRLLGANNRELGRCQRPFGSLDACRVQVALLRAGLDDAQRVVSRGSSGSGWLWSLTLGDVVLARAARLFHRERECEYSLMQFLAAAPEAALRLPTSIDSLPLVGARAFAGATGAVTVAGAAS